MEMTDHLYSFDEWCELPEDERLRIEVVDGVLTVSPRGGAFHSCAVQRMTDALRGLPQELCPVFGMDVVVAQEPLTVRIADVSVVDTAVADRNLPRFTASDLYLAVEVLSEGTRRVDRVMKFAEYAEAGIPQYWIVDLDAPISLRAFSLVNGVYEPDGEFTGAVTLSVAGHPVTLDLSALTDR